jgi:hypothetical protein
MQVVSANEGVVAGYQLVKLPTGAFSGKLLSQIVFNPSTESIVAVAANGLLVFSLCLCNNDNFICSFTAFMFLNTSEWFII